MRPRLGPRFRASCKRSTGQLRTNPFWLRFRLSAVGSASLTNRYLVCESDQKLGALLRLLAHWPDEKAIVYFATCACVDFYGKVTGRRAGAGGRGQEGGREGRRAGGGGGRAHMAEGVDAV